MIYQLSENGRKVTYTEWRKIGGCGPGNSSNANRTIGPMAHWKDKVTLGDIEDACPATGRGFARFAVDHLDKPSLALPYRSPLTGDLSK